MRPFLFQFDEPLGFSYPRKSHFKFDVYIYPSIFRVMRSRKMYGCK